jgi:hypothetical protein
VPLQLYKTDNWSIIEEGFDAKAIKSSSALVTVQWDNVLRKKKVIQATPFREVILQEYTIR